MPEGYTHVRIALEGAKRAGAEKNIQFAPFALGANGPDPLSCYRVWKKKARRGEDLSRVDHRIHTENTGHFLMELVGNACTPAQKSYTLGFLSHYAADCALHPYVYALTKPGQLYGRAGGHGYLEIAIDSRLHKKTTGCGIVPVKDTTPALTTRDREEIASLLQGALERALGEKVSTRALGDSFVHMRRLRRFFVSPTRILYGLFWLVEPLFGGRGFITGHISPARFPGGEENLPKVWTEPATGQVRRESLEELMEEGREQSKMYIACCQKVWAGQEKKETLAALLGSRSYLTAQESVSTAVR